MNPENFMKKSPLEVLLKILCCITMKSTWNMMNFLKLALNDIHDASRQLPHCHLYAPTLSWAACINRQMTIVLHPEIL